MPKIIHRRKNCIGCNSCVEHAPQRWVMDEDGKSTLKKAKAKKEVFVKTISIIEIEENERAAEDCPVNIIEVVR